MLLKAIGPFYLVSMPGDINNPTQGYMSTLTWRVMVNERAASGVPSLSVV